MSKHASNETIPPDAGGVRVKVENVGGIDACDITLSDGVTILTGQNATNRTSLLKAISGALGGSVPTLKSDTDEGRVTLTVDGESFTRTYERTRASVRVDGDPYTEESTLVDLFASLLADNPAREAVERGDDLREIIMRPVDSAAIEREVRELESRRDSIDDELTQLERDRDRVPDLEEQRTSLREEIEDTDDRIEVLEAKVEEYDQSEVTAEVEGLMDDLEGKRNRLQETLDRIDHQQTEIQSLEREREEVEAELDEIVSPDIDEAELESRIEDLRNQKRQLDGEIADLSRIADFNDDLLEENPPLADQPGDDPTAELDPMSTTVECWTCGSEVERGQIDDRLDTLRNVVAEKREEQSRVENELSSLLTERDEVRRIETRREELERRLDDIDTQIDHRRGKIEDFEAESESCREEIRDLQAEVEETEDLRDEDMAQVFEDLSDLRYKRGKLDSELESVEAELEELDDASETIEALQNEREAVADQLTELRNRVESLEKSAVEAFNDHMAAVLDTLAYDNIERVWIERKTSQSGREDATFALHIIRQGGDGTVYEDDITTLSESEREVIGIVVGLAGYLVYDVHEVCPFMLLDSLETLDADRIEALLNYMTEFAPHMVVALLPEDKQELPDEIECVGAEQLSA